MTCRWNERGEKWREFSLNFPYFNQLIILKGFFTFLFLFVNFIEEPLKISKVFRFIFLMNLFSSIGLLTQFLTIFQLFSIVKIQNISIRQPLQTFSHLFLGFSRLILTVWHNFPQFSTLKVKEIFLSSSVLATWEFSCQEIIVSFKIHKFSFSFSLSTLSSDSWHAL